MPRLLIATLVWAAISLTAVLAEDPQPEKRFLSAAEMDQVTAGLSANANAVLEPLRQVDPADIAAKAQLLGVPNPSPEVGPPPQIPPLE